MPTWAIVLIASVGGFFILAILLAIAIPTFLGVSHDAVEAVPDRAAQAGLNTALTDAKALYARDQTYPADTPTQLGRGDPALQFVAAPAPSTAWDSISLANTSEALLMTNRSASGTCWWILDVEAVPAGVGPGLPSAPGVYDDRSQGATCQASDYPTGGWQTDPYPAG
jgi:type II secretory pathway pseudopilin PulG